MAFPFIDQRQLQNRLFSRLSDMFGQEVPLYDKSLLVNSVCNRVVCNLLSKIHLGFSMSTRQIEVSSGERHGAIRIGSPKEYRWIARLFAVFAMEPHNYYDMTSVGVKSQPIVATAFRSRYDPEHRVFCSLLMTDYFDDQTRARVEAIIASRQIFSDRAKELIERYEQQGGLNSEDSERLIDECAERIFRWTGSARDYQLYTELCEAGFKIAADIACFESHHLNHLTPNTFCIDLYSLAMKFCMGELNEDSFRVHALDVLKQLCEMADVDYLQLHFKELSMAEMDSYRSQTITDQDIGALVDELTLRLRQEDLDLSSLDHSGFKDYTEGPAAGVPVLLRQDAYKALSEKVQFHNVDGSITDAIHTARFGEIEQRFYATTPQGRKIYDDCLAVVDEITEERNTHAYSEQHIKAFDPLPRTLTELLQQGLVYARYSVTNKGKAARDDIDTTDIQQLVAQGYVRAEGLRYEDFLPVSAAGIFASNLSQYGTRSTAAQRNSYSQEMLEGFLGRDIVSADKTYAAIQARSLIEVYTELGLKDRLKPEDLAEINEALVK